MTRRGERGLTPEEQALWRELTRSVRAMRPAPRKAPAATPLPPAEPATPEPAPRRVKGRVPPPRPPAPPPPAPPRAPVAVLDSGWEKRIRAGRVQTEMSVDLHGHSLASAHALLDRALAEALARGVRVLLVITGKPRPGVRPAEPGTRGGIRAEIEDWLEHSPYADRIASVRTAHPSHGGSGALYVILRRKA